MLLLRNQTISVFDISKQKFLVDVSACGCRDEAAPYRVSPDPDGLSEQRMRYRS